MSSNIKCSDTILRMAEEIALETGEDLEIIIINLLELSSYYKKKRRK